MDEKEYIVELRVTVDKEELEADGGNKIGRASCRERV